jgi:hypothetical protein
VLPELVQSLVIGLSDSIDERIRYAFDTGRISREMVGKGMLPTGNPHYLTSSIEPASAGSLLYKSRVRTEPTTVTAPQFTALIWGSLESLIDEMTVCCIKVQRYICLVATHCVLNQSTGVHPGKGSKAKKGYRNRCYVFG